MIDCYSCGTTNGQRVVCMLEETGLPYRPIWIDIARGEHRTPAFLAINPAGAIPVVVDHGSDGPLALSQSSAILLYLAEKSGMLLGAGEARLRTIEWLQFAMSDMACASASAFQVGRALGAGHAAQSFFLARTKRFLDVLEHRLEGRAFVADALSIADIALYPNVILPVVAAMIDEGGAYPNIRRWRDRVAARPGIARGIAIAPAPGSSNFK
ncbi:MAG: glutathione S-transferase N-terminal domain-containing protein [Rhizomicrobium sp.]